jgi:hypothetical protein
MANSLNSLANPIIVDLSGYYFVAGCSLQPELRFAGKYLKL